MSLTFTRKEEKRLNVTSFHRLGPGELFMEADSSNSPIFIKHKYEKATNLSTGAVQDFETYDKVHRVTGNLTWHIPAA